MKYYRQWLLGSAAIFVTACSGLGDKPDWVDQESSHYSNERYLTASAQGDSRQVADNRALANLAKVFQVSVVDKSVDFSEARISQGEVENRQNLSRVVNTNALQVLRGARIAEHWQEPDSSRFTSLAIIEKKPAAAAFTAEIKAADNFTRDAINYAASAPNHLLALNALEGARQRQINRANDNHNLRVVTGNDIAPKYTVESLTKQIRTGLSQLNFTANANNAKYLETLQSAIATVGANVVEQGGYKLSLTVEKQAVTQKQAWYWQRGSIALEVLDGDTVISQQRHAFKVSAQDKAMLTQRLHNKLTAELPEHVYALLTPKP